METTGLAQIFLIWDHLILVFRTMHVLREKVITVANVFFMANRRKGFGGFAVDSSKLLVL